MAGPKRVLPSVRDESPDDDDFEQGSGSEDEYASEDDGDVAMESAEGETASEDGEDGSENESAEDSEPDAIDAISTISFGTLAEAQASLPPSKRRRISSDAPAKPSIEDVKAKLSEMRGTKDGIRRKEREPKPKRSSKNAPSEMTSKKPVSRKREIVPIPAVKARDPRFDPSMGDFEEKRFKKNYAFLSDYRNSELEDLKEQLKKEKDEDRKATLKHRIKSMESRKLTEQKREKAEEVMREHKKKEREMVKQGKTPYYLKKSEQKKLVLVEQFSKLSDRQREKLIETKRKRKASKEKKRLPFPRRTME